MMRLIAATALAALFTQPALAQDVPAASPLTACLTAKATSADRLLLARWTFSALTAHPDMADMSNVSPAQRTQQDRAVAALFDRLLTVDCRAETKLVMGNDTSGRAATTEAFGKLGEVAMDGLMNHPAVDAAIGGFIKYMDMTKMVEVIVPRSRK